MNEIKIELTLKKRPDGIVDRSMLVTGDGFHYYELVGLVQMAVIDLAEQSLKKAKKKSKG